MISLTDVWYRTKENTILQKITFRIASGEFVNVVGVSGAGKSTVLKLIHMEILPTRGRVVVADYDSDFISGREIPYLRRKVGMIFQDFKLLEDRSVFDNVAFSLWATGTARRKIDKKVFHVLAEVGLSHKRYSVVSELSGGEQQKVAIARALVLEPFVLLADEPTGNLDSETAREIHDLLKRINSKGTAVIMATHNETLAQSFPSRRIQLSNGGMVS